MKYPVTAIKGASGTGKTTSIRTLDPEHTAIINIENQPLPFSQKFPMTVPVIPKEKHQFVAKFHKVLDAAIANDKVEVIVIDSFTSFCERMYIEADITYSDYDVWAYYNNCIRDLLFKLNEIENKIVFIMAHDDAVEDAAGIAAFQIKVQGKVWRGSVEKEFNCVLLATVNESEEGVDYRFVTNRVKGYIKQAIKSPMDMLPSTMPNDLQQVVDKYKEFYGTEEPKKKKSSAKAEQPE